MTINGSGPTSTAVVEGGARKDQLGSSIASENTKPATAAQARIIKTIKAHIVAGDKAADKADQHYRSAGQYLAALKKEHGGTWTEWEELLKTKVGISTGRASELMQIADGRKTIENVRAGKAESMKRLRASSPRGEENATADAEPEPAAAATAPQEAARRKPKRAAKKKKKAEKHELEAAQAHIAELEAAREHDTDLAEKLRMAEIKIVGLEGEIEDLKRENAELREALEGAKAKEAAS